MDGGAADGAGTADPATVREVEEGGRVLLRYVSPAGEVDPDSEPNGAVNAIAGIRNAAGNVFGLMPHPERAMEDLLGSSDGRRLLECVLRAGEVAA